MSGKKFKEMAQSTVAQFFCWGRVGIVG